MESTDDKDLLMRRVAAYLAVLVAVGFFGIIVLLMFVPIPNQNKDTVIQMLGALILAFGGLMGYLYGSSKNKESQDRALLERTAPAPIGTGPTGNPGDPVSVKESP